LTNKPQVSTKFYLAWLKKNMDEFDRSPMRAKLEYALVPTNLGAFVGFETLGRISDSGRPLERVHVSRYELLTLRGPDIPEGYEDSVERLIVEGFLSKARRANHVVPEITTTRETPGWSRMMNPSREALGAMRRVAGI
jgi:hypothetical protein